MVEIGAFTHADAGERLAGTADQSVSIALPPKVQATIQYRLSQLSTNAQSLIQIAAVIGREFTVEVLARAYDQSEDALVPDLDELWRKHIVREQGAVIRHGQRHLHQGEDRPHQAFRFSMGQVKDFFQRQHRLNCLIAVVKLRPMWPGLLPKSRRSTSHAVPERGHRPTHCECGMLLCGAACSRHMSERRDFADNLRLLGQRANLIQVQIPFGPPAFRSLGDDGTKLFIQIVGFRSQGIR